MNSNYYVVIMAGGVGARFWPMSKTSRPKQFIDILGIGESLIQQTYARFKNICPTENIFVVTSSLYKNLVLEQLPEIKSDRVLCEPYRKNTAPCIAYANYKISKINPDAIIVVAPSDHIVLKNEVFTDVINTAMKKVSDSECLVTLGIRPSYPNTGYGYIQYDDKEDTCTKAGFKKVKTFTEKPNIQMAKSFIESGDFLWNAGIFIWSLKSSMQAIKMYLPEVDELFASVGDRYNTIEEEEYIEKVYLVCKNISIDYGVMEKAKNVYVLAADFGWSDLGTWGSLYDMRTKNDESNAIVGRNVLTYDTKGCIINMPKNKLVVIQGLEDYIVAESGDTLLICKLGEEQQIRRFLSDVSIEKGEEFV